MKIIYISTCSLILYSNLNYIELDYTKKNKYVVFNNILINTVKVEIEIFEKYNSFMWDNDIYFIVSVLDFWIKT